MSSQQFKKITSSLFFLFCLSTLSAQRLVNNGAYMSVASGAYLEADTIYNTSGSFVNSGTIDVADNFNNAATMSGNGLYKLGGLFSNSGSFTSGTSTVNFYGSTAQTVPALNFYNLTISGGSLKTLSGPDTVSGILTLTSGYVISSTSNPLILTNGATVSGGSASSFVDGEFRKIGDLNTYNGFTFPVGDYVNSGTKMYKKIKLANLSNAYNSNPDENYFTVHYHYFPSSTWVNANDKRNFKINNDFKNATKLNKIGTTSYWEIERQGNSNQSNAKIDITYYWDSENPLQVSILKIDSLSIAHFDHGNGNNGKWEDARETNGNRDASERLPGGTLTSGNLTITNVASFSPFSEASTSDASSTLGPLPVELINFTARATPEKKVVLSWATASESVNKGFRIEKQTIDMGSKFENIGFVSSKATAGNSQTNLYYNFLDNTPKSSAANHYRLVQEDLDGTLTYSEVRMIRLGGQSLSMVFPNPSAGGITISRTADDKKMNIQIIDLSGKVVKEFNNIAESYYKFNITQPGVYNIKMTFPETGEQSIQRVVVQR